MNRWIGSTNPETRFLELQKDAIVKNIMAITVIQPDRTITDYVSLEGMAAYSEINSKLKELRERDHQEKLRIIMLEQDGDI